MTDNSSKNKELEALVLLYNVRANMQSFCQNNDNNDALTGVLSNYNELLDNDLARVKLNEAIKEYIFKQITADDFNFYQFKTSSEKEDKKRRSETKKSKKQNTETATLIKQIREDIAYNALRKDEFKNLENAEILSISINEDSFCVKIKGHDEPLKYPVKTKNGKYFSLLWHMSTLNPKGPKAGIDNKSYNLIKSCGPEGYILQEAEKPEDLGKRYSPSDYRKLLGLARTEELSDTQKKELEFLNKLTISDQNNFVTALKKRVILLKKNKEISDFVLKTEDKIGLMIEPERLQQLLKKNDLPDFVIDMQQRFVPIIQQDKNLWNNFSKKDEENSQRFSHYEVMQNNLIARNSEIFEDAFNGEFKDKSDVKRNVEKCFSHIRHLSEPALPDGLCAEIAALGIFKEAMKPNTDSKKLEKMNLLLNEFGLNVDFKYLQVTQVPDEAIKGASEQSKIDRQKFEDLKKTGEYSAEEKSFNNELRERGINKVDAASTHHYIALKYNAFVEPELNDNSLLVKTAREHAWNYDGHDMVHLFDTAGEFLIKDENNGYSFADFNRLRNRFNNGEKMEILAPVLQIKAENGKFNDLLSLGENGKSGHYISDNSTLSIIKTPEYCHSALLKTLTKKCESSITKRFG